MTLAPATVGAALRDAATRLEMAGLEDSYREAVVLLARHLKCPPALVYVRRYDPLSEPLFTLFLADADRRARREPTALIQGERAFFAREFFVTSDTLVPRPETELLVETVLENAREGMTVLDIGAGTGCIGVTLAAENPGLLVTAVDVSEAALAVARRNAERHGVSGRIEFLKSSLFDTFTPAGGRYFDIIVSNPPYVSTRVIPTLEPELKFEPRIALDGGEDGLDVVRPLIAGAVEFLRGDGGLFLEIGFDQAVRVSDLMSAAGFTNVVVKQDLEGHDRVLSGVKSGSI